MATYEAIATSEQAEQHVAEMVAHMAHRIPEQDARDIIREDASDVWKRAMGSVLDDANARSLGASLVILTLNRIEGRQS